MSNKMCTGCFASMDDHCVCKEITGKRLVDFDGRPQSETITATTFQLNCEDPKKFKFEVGDRAISPLGAVVITNLCPITGNCEIHLDMH
jgi:hypothetical protein